MATKVLAPVKGMPDIVPEQMPFWHRAECAIKNVLESYGYDELRTPILEKTALFQRSIGDETDIVSKEMFTFESRGGESLTLRPEATASCVRAGITRGLLHNQRRRIYYYGPMFRYEQPQEGRYRQFYQIGAEAYGLPGPDVDVEMICMLTRIWKALDLKNLTLKINCLGSGDGRQRYVSTLREYFLEHKAVLDEDSLRRLKTNPLRILDSKHSSIQQLVDEAPSAQAFLSPQEAEHFASILYRLDRLGISAVQDARLVRGLDYYTGTVFEWQTEQLGAQNAICGGGRYDQLIQELGGRATKAVGWAMGMERLIALMAMGDDTIAPATVDVYLVTVGEAAAVEGTVLLEQLRTDWPDAKMIAHGSDGSFKSQLRAADKCGARIALILGDDEVDSKSVALKPLRGGEQIFVSWNNLSSKVKEFIE